MYITCTLHVHSILSYTSSSGPQDASIIEMPVNMEDHTSLQLHVEANFLKKFQAFQVYVPLIFIYIPR